MIRWGRARNRRTDRDLGDAARDSRDWQAAAGHYRRWLGAHPQDAAIHIQLGHMLGEAGHFDEAAAAYGSAARLTPDDADLALCRGHLAARAGDVGGGARLLRRQRGAGWKWCRARRAGRAAPARRCRACAGGAGREQAPEPAPHWSGQLEGWLRHRLSGIAYPPDERAAWIDLSMGGTVIGHAALGPPDEDGGRRFHAHADFSGPSAEVTVRLMPAGLELDRSPVLLVTGDDSGQGPPLATAADILVARAPAAEAMAGEVALLVTHSPAGAIKPHVASLVAALKDAGVDVVLVIAADRPVRVPDALAALCAGVIVRANAGYDFAAWAHVLHLFPALYGARTLYLANDSVFGPADPAAFGQIIERVRATDAALVGLTASHEWQWHLQSYFLALKPALLTCWALHDFMRDVRNLDDKDAVIRAYEARLTRAVEAAGLDAVSLFDSPAAINPTLFDWRGLVSRGFPFVKLLLLRGAFAEADISGWRDVLATAGFDLDLLDRTLLPGPSGVPDGGDRHLLDRPLKPAEGALPAPLKVAFYGPFNHDNGLGAASRAMVGALRASGVALNLSPVRRPFHIHRPLGPGADVRDFEGQADIALVHLNPDSWHLLDDAQRSAIAHARRRIGYWVWEMEELPPQWAADFHSVDRVWAPTQWVADAIAAAAPGLGVDVVPHVLPPAGPATVDGRALMTALGVPEGGRTILYVFDGSSYLVRKNPAALVRAFAASGLGAQGWRLVLKTKHLMDRPADGAALADLAAATDGVILVDRTMDDAQLAALISSCDIYASPHCAEGFGLTVAEAMAAGRNVVATDYSGTRDLLDGTTGWPVRAHGWVLAENHGHYLAGNRWARVDEPALAHALTQAAAAVEAGDTARATAGRDRAVERLSQARVAALALQSFHAALDGDRRHVPAGGRVGAAIEAGIPVADAGHLPGAVVQVAVLPADDVPPGDAPWIMLAPAGTLVAPMLDMLVDRAAALRPDATILIADDFAAAADRATEQLRLWPEFDPLLAVAAGYDGAAILVRRAALHALGMPGGSMDAFLIRAARAGHSIARVPHVLLARRDARPVADRAARRRVLAPLFANHDLVDGAVPGGLALARRWHGDEPRVTLLVPTRRGGPPHVARLLDALAHTDWPMDRLTVLVGDDVAGPADWADAPRPYTLGRIETLREADAPFNYAAKMNALIAASADEHLVMLNDDVLPADAGWLRALMTFAVEPEVGGVGALLRHPDGRLQHAGIAPSHGRVAHLWAGRHALDGTYMGWALAQRRWSMVTGAVFATRRSALTTVGGFDERFSLEFNDIDLCLRLRMAGYSIVYQPEARLTHVEKASRGDAPPPGPEIAAFLTRWRGWLNEDPAWHPRFEKFALEPVPIHGSDPWYG